MRAGPRARTTRRCVGGAILAAAAAAAASLSAAPAAAVAAAASAAVAAPCASALDCSLNGVCDAAGLCTCDPAWTGPSCSVLNLVPMEPARAAEGAYRPGPRTSWGANVLRSAEDGMYHMFVAEMKGNCTLTSWIPNSQVVHAVATTAEGPFTFREVLFDTFHHNPRLTRGPDGEFLLFMIGGAHGPGGNCSGIPTGEGEDLDTRIVVSTARSLNGPWSTPSAPLLARGAAADWDFIVTNPSPIILPNGTTLLYYRGTPKYWGSAAAGPPGAGAAGRVSEASRRDGAALATAGGAAAPNDLPESVGLAVAPHWSGPYTRVFAEPILRVMNEDPFAWRDARGNFHLLTHGRDDWWNTHHSYSVDGLSWSSGADVAADPNITLTNGSVYRFTNRERPQIFFNETTGAPALLFTGVCPGEKYTYAYTLAQRIHQ